jgi:uncharacterized protein (DUF1330 family)
MSGRVYSLVIAKVHDRQRFDAYGIKVAELMARYPGARLAMLAPEAVHLEGDWETEGVELAIMEWPSVDAQLAFWNSPEYQALKREREGLASILSYCGEFVELGR